MRVLWLSNRLFENSAEKQSGTWLKSLAAQIALDPSFALGNISIGNARWIERCDYQSIAQWQIPNAPVRNDGLPNATIVDSIRSTVAEFKPDIIQVWGTEGYWGLLTARGILPGKHILNIQGVLGGIQSVYDGGLTNAELITCIGIKELLNPAGSLIIAKQRFKRRIKFENEIIKGHRFIVTQSNWSSTHVSAINPLAVCYTTQRTLRQEFIEAVPWSFNQNRDPVIFTSCAGRAYKGIHTLIRATSLVRKDFPKIRLIISGAHVATGIRMNGYDKWLRRLVRDCDLAENVDWQGMLSADKIIDNLQQCSVFVNPSFVESYSLSLSEALCLGVPSVASYAGAMPELAMDNQSALYFTPGDHFMCAQKIKAIITNPSLSTSLSNKARVNALARHNSAEIVANQKNIYRSVIDKPL